MMKCGFCDCFGPFIPFRKKDELDVPLDQNTLNRCLELVQAHEARQDMLLKSSEHQRPLISTVCETCVPYGNDMKKFPQPPHKPNFWHGTPPPSYRSSEMQKEREQNQGLLGRTSNIKM